LDIIDRVFIESVRLLKERLTREKLGVEFTLPEQKDFERTLDALGKYLENVGIGIGEATGNAIADGTLSAFEKKTLQGFRNAIELVGREGLEREVLRLRQTLDAELEKSARVQGAAALANIKFTSAVDELTKKNARERGRELQQIEIKALEFTGAHEAAVRASAEAQRSVTLQALDQMEKDVLALRAAGAKNTEALEKQIADTRIRVNQTANEQITRGLRDLNREREDLARQLKSSLTGLEIQSFQISGDEEAAIRARAELQRDTTLQGLSRLEEQIKDLREKGSDDAIEIEAQLAKARVLAAKVANDQILKETARFNQRREQLQKEVDLSRARIRDLTKPTRPDFGPFNLLFGVNAESFEDATRKLQEFKRRSEELKVVFSGDELVSQQRRLEELFQLDTLERALRERKEQVEEFANFLADKFTDTFIAIADGTKSLKDGFKSLISDILSDLQRVLVRAVILQGIMAGLAKLGSIFPGAGGVIGTIIGAISPGGPAAQKQLQAALQNTRSANLSMRSSILTARSARISAAAAKAIDSVVEGMRQAIDKFSDAVTKFVNGLGGGGGGGVLRTGGFAKECCECNCVCVLDGVEEFKTAAEEIKGSADIGASSAALGITSAVLNKGASTQMYVAAINMFKAAKMLMVAAVSTAAQSSSASIGSGFGSTQKGGITTREGLIYVHPQEAIIPLNDPRAQGLGLGGGININQTFVVDSAGARQTDDGDSSRDDRAEELSRGLREVVREYLQDEMRSGGILEGAGRPIL
jgi:hypothetical protein